MSLQDVMRRVMRATRLNTEYFARQVTYRLADGTEIPLTIAARHRERIRHEPDGSESIIEELHVEIDRDALAEAPDFGCRIILEPGDPAYLYAYQGKIGLVSYRVVFARDRDTAQGTRVGVRRAA